MCSPLAEEMLPRIPSRVHSAKEVRGQRMNKAAESPLSPAPSD
jgi:hypothetical protein